MLGEPEGFAVELLAGFDGLIRLGLSGGWRLRDFGLHQHGFGRCRCVNRRRVSCVLLLGRRVSALMIVDWLLVLWGGGGECRDLLGAHL